MIPVDFFGCKSAQLFSCSWEEACDRFPFTGITIPDESALTSLGEALTGNTTFSAETIVLKTGQFQPFLPALQAVIRSASTEELLDAGARWARLPPWNMLDPNPMDLAGFLLHLQSLVSGSEREENDIFLWVDAGSVPSPGEDVI